MCVCAFLWHYFSVSVKRANSLLIAFHAIQGQKSINWELLCGTLRRPPYLIETHLVFLHIGEKFCVYYNTECNILQYSCLVIITRRLPKVPMWHPIYQKMEQICKKIMPIAIMSGVFITSICSSTHFCHPLINNSSALLARELSSSISTLQCTLTCLILQVLYHTSLLQEVSGPKECVTTHS